MVEKNIEQIWQDLLSEASTRLPQGAADLWLKTCIPVEILGDSLVLDVPNVFVKEQISSRFLKDLTVLVKERGIAGAVEFRVGSETRKDEQVRAERAAQGTQQQPNSRSGLNPSYVFSTFVVGKSNRLSNAASLAVAETPGEAYNPLFIWGGVGLGKTHLMHAIGHYALDRNPNAKIAYISSEKFINEFIQSIQKNRTQEFKSKYRNMDILLIDDIQFLGSDRPPKDIQNIEDRLVSRFEWGLVTDIQSPDLETRIAILQKKAQLKKYQIPEDVILFLAQNIPSNIRELEGALNRVVACAELNSEAITPDNAADWLKDVIRKDVRGPVGIEAIQQAVAESFGMSMEDMVSSRRTSELALARQVAMFLCRKKTEASLQQIGLAFKKKDHTTVLHAQRKIAQLVEEQPRMKQIVDNIEQKL